MAELLHGKLHICGVRARVCVNIIIYQLKKLEECRWRMKSGGEAPVACLSKCYLYLQNIPWCRILWVREEIKIAIVCINSGFSALKFGFNIFAVSSCDRARVSVYLAEIIRNCICTGLQCCWMRHENTMHWQQPIGDRKKNRLCKQEKCLQTSANCTLIMGLCRRYEFYEQYHENQYWQFSSWWIENGHLKC